MISGPTPTKEPACKQIGDDCPKERDWVAEEVERDAQAKRGQPEKADDHAKKERIFA